MNHLKYVQLFGGLHAKHLRVLTDLIKPSPDRARKDLVKTAVNKSGDVRVAVILLSL